MKPSSWDKQLGLPLPLKSAASQSDQTNNPSKDEVRNEVGAGCKSPRPHLSEGLGESFFLDRSCKRNCVNDHRKRRIGNRWPSTRHSLTNYWPITKSRKTSSARTAY